METYIRIQEHIRLSIEKARVNYKKSPKERITVPYLETRLETLEKHWGSYIDTHKLILSEFGDKELMKTSYYTTDAYDVTEELCTEYKTELKEALLKLKISSDSVSLSNPVSNVSRVDQSFSVQLPKISIPTFSGQYTEWTSFRDLFTSLIHNNKGLDDVQRLHYLKSYLSGEAEQLLRHIPITATNYKACWDQLEHRYNNKKHLANCILKRFINQKNVLSESSSAVKELLDTTNECLNALKNLNIDISSWDIIVIYIVSLKLDTESRKLWEVQVSKLTDELPKFSEFKEFLDQRFRSLEFLDTDKTKSNSTRTSKVMHVATAESCNFCSGSHKLINCKKFAKEDVDERRKFVQTNRLCFNCLGSTHSVFSCRQSTSCRICRRRHHSLLHPKPVPRSDHECSGQPGDGADHSSSPSSASPGEVSNIVTCFSNLSSQVLLATALIKVEARTGTFFLRSLLDQGSQASFITESAVQMLGLKKISKLSCISGLGSDQAASMQSKWFVTIRVQSRHDPNFAVDVKAHVINKITSMLPEKKIILKFLSSQISVGELADPLFDTPNKVDLLLGAEVYGQILLEGVIKGPPGSPVAQNTKLGWILSGCIHSSPNQSHGRQNTVVSMHTHVTTDDLLKRFWELEEPPLVSQKILTEEEQAYEDFFAKTHTRDESGRYVVKLPFKSTDPQCQYGNSFEVAKRRFYLLENRWMDTGQDNVHTELQGFSDASNSAYAAVVYDKTVSSDSKVHVNMVASKSRIAPVKQVSIPRLELCGAALLAKLLQEVSEVLSIPKVDVHAWTDSSVVLAWLGSHPSKWKTFVANRVSEILTIMDNGQWSHVSSEDNPADCASRGVSPGDLAENELWRRGPKWLQEDTVHYSKINFGKTSLEEKKEKVLCHMMTESESIISRFSNLTRLIRTISYCKRFVNLSKANSDYKPTRWLTTIEIKCSLLTCIRLCQGEKFLEEIDSLKRLGNVSKNSKLTSLNPFVDGEGILRVGGRLQNANVVEDMKHPILIPYKSHLTNLIVADAHERTLHGGPQLMLNYLRTQYWVINAKNLVRQHVRKCVVCVRHAAQTNQQLMGQLPSSRITACRPFHQTGVDYAGPIAIRPSKGRGYHSSKGYICLFICMATRAIHLEVVSDLTSDAYLAAFKRFVARRGHCADLWSDNGTNFVGANRELKQLFNQERSFVASDIADWLASNGTNWHFIPPQSPNFGGLWEAGVKSTKHHLKRVIANSTLTFEEMTTLLCQIEACLNSRPISQISTNPEDPIPLTPGHFLVGEPLVLVPDANFERSNMSTLKRWHFTQRLVQDFWRRWSQEYLTQLQHRYKWSHITPEPKVGDIVLVKENDLPPARWLYGMITDKHSGLDNLTRVVSLKCKGSIIKRPVSKLIILPVTS